MHVRAKWQYSRCAIKLAALPVFDSQPICAKFDNTYCIFIAIAIACCCCYCFNYLVMYFKNKVKCETYLLYLFVALIKISFIHVFDQITNLL